MKLGDVVEVVWDDHCFKFGEYTGEGVMRMRSCGYFVREDDDIIAIAVTLAEGKKPNDVQVIDKRMLRSKRRIR